MSASWSVAVVVPACNEEGTIEDCIAAILAACGRAPGIASAWIVIVADSCTDRTALLARRALGAAGSVVECRVRSSGAARRIGAQTALAHLDASNPRGIWIANTDADTIVPADWLDVQLRYADQGYGGVAGLVGLDARSCAAPEVMRVFAATYPIDGDDSHTHVHGANVGVRGDAYLAVDGWSCLALAEDHCLWERLRRSGCRLLASTRSVVLTSARLQGRARGGFADTLRTRLEAAHARP